MKKNAFDKPALIRLRLENAIETLQAAHTLYEHDASPKSIVNRAYYAMFYATLALLVTTDSHSSKHSGVIALFDKEFVKNNIFSKELGKMLHEAFESRQEGDYKDYSQIDRKKASEILESADEFVKTIKEKLKEKL
jgi:uncharacterized protein (UPF0332 family)